MDKMELNVKIKDGYEGPPDATEWAITKTKNAMDAFNVEPTPEKKNSARAWAKRLDYELAKHTN